MQEYRIQAQLCYDMNTMPHVVGVLNGYKFTAPTRRGSGLMLNVVASLNNTRRKIFRLSLVLKRRKTKADLTFHKVRCRKRKKDTL